METINLKKLASKFEAWKSSIKSNNPEWTDKHSEEIKKMLENLPSGSGIDAGVKFDWFESTSERLIFTFGFHHMDENGYYDGWTEHKLTITPSLAFRYHLRISGKDRNQVKDYLYDLFSSIFFIG